MLYFVFFFSFQSPSVKNICKDVNKVFTLHFALKIKQKLMTHRVKIKKFHKNYFA